MKQVFAKIAKIGEEVRSSEPMNVEFAAKWLQVWKSETEKAIVANAIVPALERFINEYKQSVSIHAGVARKMQPFIESAKELGANNIVADINEQLQFNKEMADKDMNIIQGLERALQIVKQN
jgi:phage portal protein BeeE